MLLGDVYCLYNRARGTDPISPEDLLEAVKLQGPLGLGMRLRTYAGGGGGGTAAAPLLVLQLDSFDERAVQRRIVDALARAVKEVEAAGAAASSTSSSPHTLARDPFVSPLDIATREKLPLPIAKQHLLLAEAAGLLCRDDSVHGLRFYVNRFGRGG
jgi:ESCRT-II complex subunit VPS36